MPAARASTEQATHNGNNCSPHVRQCPVGTTIAMTICRFHWSGFSGAQVINQVYWSTPVVWLHGAVFVPVLFRGIFSGPRRRCLQIQGPRLVRAATPGVPVSVVCDCIVCTIAQRPSSGCCGLYRHRCIGTGSEFSRCSTSSCYYAFVAVLRVSMHIVCIVCIVRVHLLSGPVADMRCGPQPKGSPQQRQVY